jgi:hypothetical protein
MLIITLVYQYAGFYSGVLVRKYLQWSNITLIMMLIRTIRHWQWWGVGGSAMAGNVGASVVAHWRGDGIITVLAPACWCQKRSDPTINMRWKG